MISVADKKIKERLEKIKKEVRQMDPDQIKKLAEQAAKNKELLKHLNKA